MGCKKCVWKLPEFQGSPTSNFWSMEVNGNYILYISTWIQITTVHGLMLQVLFIKYSETKWNKCAQTPWKHNPAHYLNLCFFWHNCLEAQVLRGAIPPSIPTKRAGYSWTSETRSLIFERIGFFPPKDNGKRRFYKKIVNWYSMWRGVSFFVLESVHLCEGMWSGFCKHTCTPAFVSMC